MNEIIVKTQEELDNVPMDYHGRIIIKFGTWLNPAILKKSYDYARAVLWDNASAVLWGNASAVLRDNARAVKAKYREFAKSAHPDAGGDEEAFLLLRANLNKCLTWFAENGRTG